MSQEWSVQKQFLELESAYRSELQGRASLEAQVSALQKAGTAKDTKIMEQQRCIETYESEPNQLRGGP